MVFIREVATVKRESDIASRRKTIEAQLEELRDIAANEVSLQRLKAISSNIQKLCSGKKELSEEAKAKDRAYHKRRYIEKKDMILGEQRKQRKELRELKELVQGGENVSAVVNGSH